MSGKITFENVPYRRWRGKIGNVRLVQSKAYDRVMARVGPLLKAGRTIQMEHKIVCDGSEKPNSVYDSISITIGAA